MTPAQTNTTVRDKFVIGGKERTASQRLAVTNPYNDEVIAEVGLASPDDLETAVKTACAGFEKTRRLAPYERADILLRIRDSLVNDQNSFAETICLETGKPIQEARREVNRCILTFTIAAEETKRLHGDYLDLGITEMGKNRAGLFKPFPIGPILAITPFNFPLNQVAGKLAPAIAIGTSFIVKPASKTPLSALKLAHLIIEAGYPPEAVNVTPCEAHDAEALVQDERIRLLSFTGSAAVGWKLKSLAGKKKVILELGGNAGVIIDETADASHAAARCAMGAYSFAGQTCISVQRVFAHARIRERFLQTLLENVKKIKSGNPLDESTTLGPLIDENAAKRSESWIAEAVRQGATLVTGGKRQGKFLDPTILTNVKPDMKISCEEVFAPLLAINSFTRFEDALSAVNNSRYGLQAGVFTNDFSRVMQAYQELEVGGVMVNEVPTWRVDSMPYGGVKDSGFGREGVPYAMREMTEGKLLVIPT